MKLVFISTKSSNFETIRKKRATNKFGKSQKQTFFYDLWCDRPACKILSWSKNESLQRCFLDTKHHSSTLTVLNCLNCQIACFLKGIQKIGKKEKHLSLEKLKKATAFELFHQSPTNLLKTYIYYSYTIKSWYFFFY